MEVGRDAGHPLVDRHSPAGGMSSEMLSSHLAGLAVAAVVGSIVLLVWVALGVPSGQWEMAGTVAVGRSWWCFVE